MTTVYLDTSSLAKLYIEQDGSDDVRQDLAAASAAVTSLVAPMVNWPGRGEVKVVAVSVSFSLDPSGSVN